MKRPKKWDFEGWATRYEVPCSDGETIARGAFKNMDGETVSLVDDHARGYDSFLDAVIGKAVLEHRNEGVYAYLTFNKNYDIAMRRREQVMHGDIQRLSIRANMLKRVGGKIVDGIIRDLSIVASGANPGAFIQQAQLVHHDGYTEDIEDEAYICFNDEVKHGADSDDYEPPRTVRGVPDIDLDDEIEDVMDTYLNMTEEEKKVSMFIGAGILSVSGNGEEIHQSDDYEENGGEEMEDYEMDYETASEIFDEMVEEYGEEVNDVLDGVIETILTNGEAEIDEDEQEFFLSLPDEEREALALLAAVIVEEGDDDDDDDYDDEDDEEYAYAEINQSDRGGSFYMKANRFNSRDEYEDNYVGVDEFMSSIRRGSTFEQACIEHGIDNVTDLYDQPKLVNPEPLIVNTPQGWVKSVLGGVKKVPFTKIKSLWTDLSAFEGEHRALGYPVLGEKKKDEEISMLNRITEPGWIYKRQTLDRDVLYQITSFNFLQWIQAEMGMMLNQELARAILIGDGRLANSPYKIKEDRVRPVAYDSSVWTVQDTLAASATTDDILDELIDLRSDYQGSGSPTLFVSGKQIGDWLKLKNSLGERIYKNADEIASLVRCREIIEVPQLGVATQADGAKIKAIMVNLGDYALSMPTGASALKDTRFDIDVNKETYLLEWLVGGALTTPKSALVVNQSV